MGVVADLGNLVRRRERDGRRARRDLSSDRHAVGARATASALSGLDPFAWRVLHGVAWPGRPQARLDHVVVGPPGVLVVDSRNWPGAVITTAGVLRQDGARRQRDLVTAREAALAVADRLEGPGWLTVTGVLCFTPPAMVTGWIDDVLLCATGDVVAVFDSLPARLEPEEVDELAERAVVALAPEAVSRRVVPQRPPLGEAQAGS